MKRKFILLPITLTALTPAISLAGCGDQDTPEPEPVEEIVELNNFTTGYYGGQLESDLISLDTSTTYKLTADYSKTNKSSFSDITLYDGSEWFQMYITPIELKIDQNVLKPYNFADLNDNKFGLFDYKYGETGRTHLEFVFVCSTQTNNSKLEFTFKFWSVPINKTKFILYNRAS